MPYNLNMEPNELYIDICAIAFIVCMVYFIIKSINIRKDNRLPKNINQFNYRKNQRKTQNKYARKRYQAKTKQPTRKYDPEMFSNEPLDFEKAGNLKYKAYVQAQWDEMNKKYYGGK